MERKNRRGEVPITILVIGVFAVCSMALFTFFVADFKMSNSFVGVEIMQKMDASIDEYNFYVDNGMNPNKVAGFFPIIKEGNKRYIYYSKNKSSNFGLSGSKTLAFSVKYPIR